MSDQAVASVDSTNFEDFKLAIAAHAEGKLSEEGTVVKETPKPENDDTNAGAVDDTNGEGTGGNVDETDEEKAQREEAEAAVAAAKEKNKGKSVSQRIKEFRRSLTDAQEAAEIEAAEGERQRLRAEKAEKELEELRKNGGKPPKGAKTTYTPEEGEPNPDEYEFGILDPSYTRDMINFRVEKAREADRTAASQSATVKEQNEKFEATIAKGLEKHDDYLQVVVEGADQGKWRLTPLGAQVLIDSEFGHEVAYHLAKNPALAADIADMPPHRQAAALGRLEAQFAIAADDTTDKGGTGQQQTGANTQQQQTPKNATGAPPPHGKQPKGANGEFEARPDTKDLNAYRRLVERKQQGK